MFFSGWVTPAGSEGGQPPVEWRYLVLGHPSGQPMSIYNRALEKLEAPEVMPAGMPYACAANHAGTVVAVGCNIAPYLHLYRADNWSVHAVPAISPAGGVRALHFTGDDAFLMVVHQGGQTLTLYETQNWTPVASGFSRSNANIWDAVWLPAQQMWVMGFATAPYLERYDMANQQLLPALATTPASRVNVVELSADGQWLVAMENGRYVHVYDVQNWQRINTPMPRLSVIPRAVAFSGDKSRMVLGMDSLRAFDGFLTADWTREVPMTVNPGAGCHALALSPDGQMLVAGVRDSNRLYLYDAADWSVLSPPVTRPAANVDKLFFIT